MKRFEATDNVGLPYLGDDEGLNDETIGVAIMQTKTNVAGLTIHFLTSNGMSVGIDVLSPMSMRGFGKYLIEQANLFEKGLKNGNQS